MKEGTTTSEPVTDTMPALDAAVVNDDLGSYREAWAAEKKGTPLPPVAKPGVLSDEDYQKLRTRQEGGDFLSDVERKSLRATSRARQQDKVNEKAQKAAQRVADDYEAKLKEANERAQKAEEALKTRAAAPVEVPRPPAPVAVETAPTDGPKAPDPNDATKYPGGIYDPEYIADKALHKFQMQQAEREKTDRETTARETAQKGWTEAKLRFSESLKTAESDPDLKAAMDSDLGSKHLIPAEEIPALIAANILPKTFQAQPINKVASAIVMSPVGPQLLKHFHQHPDVLDRVLREGPMAFYRLEGQLLATAPSSAPPSAPAPSPAPKRVTDAPPPPPSLGTREAAPTDPLSSAIREGQGNLTGGVRDYNAARRSEMAAGRR